MPSATFELTGSTWNMPLGRSVSAKNSASRSDPIGVALRRLHDDRRADRERGRDLVRHEVQREVERRDPEHRPDREPADQPDARAERRPRCPGASARRRRGGSPRTPTGTSRPRGSPRPSPTSAACRPPAAISSRSPRSSPPGACEMWSSASARACTGRFLRLLERLGGRRDGLLDVGSAVGTPISATTLSSYGLWTSNVPSPVRHSPFTRNGPTRSPSCADSLPSVVLAAARRPSRATTITCLMFV